MRFRPKGPFDCLTRAIGPGPATNIIEKAQWADRLYTGNGYANGRPFGPHKIKGFKFPGRWPGPGKRMGLRPGTTANSLNKILHSVAPRGRGDSCKRKPQRMRE